MFTGLVSELVSVKKLDRSSQGLRFAVDLSVLAAQVPQIGESICLNGVCYTLEHWEDKEQLGYFFASRETLERSTFGWLQPGQTLNLERSLTLADRMGGHVVTGHVDGLAKLLSLRNKGESYWLSLELPTPLSRYVAHKGSVALDGISLTSLKDDPASNIFSVAVIPHTWRRTNLHRRRAGDLLNFEADLLAKYVESLLLSANRAEI